MLPIFPYLNIVYGFHFKCTNHRNGIEFEALILTITARSNAPTDPYPEWGIVCVFFSSLFVIDLNFMNFKEAVYILYIHTQFI